MKKGISPLIASVLLIAFTMAIAGLAGPFLTEVTQKAQGDTVNKSQTIVDSTNARLEVISTSYNSSNSSYEVTIRNSGSDSVQDFTATIYGDSPKQKQINKKLEAGEVHTFDIAEAGNSTSIEVEARDLPVKTDADLSQEDGSSSSGGGGSSTVSMVSLSLSSGTFNGTTDYKPGNDNLSIGYRNGSSGGDLVAFWRLDGDSGSVTDYSANGNDGSTDSFDGDERGAQGVFSTSSFNFDGSNDHVDNPTISEDYNTISFWFKPSQKFDGGESFQMPMTAANDVGYWIALGEVSGGMSGETLSIGAPATGASQAITETITKDWHHFVVSWDSGNSEYDMYLDGEEKSWVSGSAGSADLWSSLDLVLGGRSANSDGYFDGKMEEVRVYNESLTTSEINSLYRYGSPYKADYNSSEVDPSGSDHNWQDLEVDAFIPEETDLSANFSALDSSGNLVEDHIITIDTNGTKNYSVSVSNSDKAIVNFNGTTSNVTKTWEISEANIYYE